MQYRADKLNHQCSRKSLKFISVITLSMSYIYFYLSNISKAFPSNVALLHGAIILANVKDVSICSTTEYKQPLASMTALK